MLSPDEFRALALALPEVVEGEHQAHPDFRVGGKIFATLGPDGTWGMVKLSPEGQAAAVLAAPGAFQPFPGAWGKAGCTKVVLARARKAAARDALAAAWRFSAPRALLEKHGAD